MLLNKWQTTYNKSNKNIIWSSISAHSFVYPCWCKCVETFKIQSAWFNKGFFLGYFNLVCAAKPYLVHSSVLCFEKLLFRFWRLCPCLYIRTLHGIMIRIINSNENQLRKWYSTLLTLLKGIKETSAALICVCLWKTSRCSCDPSSTWEKKVRHCNGIKIWK